MKIKQIIFIIITIFILIYLLSSPIQAAGIGMSISKTSGYVGDSFSITISGINGKVSISGNSNVSLSQTGSVWVDGSLTITGTAKSVGTGTITVKPIDATTTSADPEEVTTSASRSITIKQKESTSPTPTPTPAPTPTPNTSTTTTKKNTTNSKTTTKVETPKDTSSTTDENFYIKSLNLKGIKENEEQIQIELSPTFDPNVYEYTCNISADIQKLELEKDAGEYTNSIIVTGLDDLKEGENTITLLLAAEDHQSKTYTIKVIKEKTESIETIAEPEEEQLKQDTKQNNQILITMPLWLFIIVQIVVIVVEALIIYFVVPKILKYFKKK